MDDDGDDDAITLAANQLGEDLDADIIIYNAPIYRPYDDNLITECIQRNKRKNVILVLITEGGDPDAGYRIARCLQNSYEKFTVIIPGYCKSAGTLIALGAHEVLFGYHGELGPLDIQMAKKDTLVDMQSGLTVTATLTALVDHTYKAFEQYFLDIENKSGGIITVNTASRIAAQLAGSVITPIATQVDPMHIGEAARASSIALHYGSRLGRYSHNLYPHTIKFLLTGYPSHGFVIDNEEAELLFRHTRLVEKEGELLAAMGREALTPKRLDGPGTDGVAFSFLNAAEDRGTGDEQDAEGESDRATDDGPAGRPGRREGNPGVRPLKRHGKQPDDREGGEKDRGTP